MNHTPTPWRSDGFYIETCNSPHQESMRIAKVVYDDSSDGPEQETKENIKFIVRACNAYEELLDAAKHARNCWEWNKTSSIYVALNKAINKAEGK